ncbi:MFS transporter [Glaciibacter superstes]|uniref:MFS transporter n=1 Tax=Glaciibacter superstes TaxID=501023 RepID=UPI0003B3486B|nr:MFS transporter [Glaciibacter superstes]
MSTIRTRISFWTAASVAMLALWASAAPSMIYPVYARDWNLSPTVITSLFAVYPIALVVVLVIFGSISDHIGRRSTLLVGVAVLLAGAVIFAVATDVAWLFVARALQGIGVGLAMSPASAAMVEFNARGGTARASSVNTVATALGLALATIVAGALVEYAPAPRQLSYWVLFGVGVLVFVAVLYVPRHVRGTEDSARWRPRPIRIPARLRGVVTAASLAVTAGFAVGAVLLSLGAQIAQDLIHTENSLVTGSVLAITSVVIGLTALAARRVPARVSVMSGGVISALAVGLLAVSATTSSLGVFALMSVTAGIGYGLLFLGGLGLVNQHAPSRHRAATLSAVYLVAYLAQGIIAVAVGVVATSVGLRVAIDVAAPVLVLLCLVTSGVAIVFGREPRPVTASLQIDQA